MERQVEQWFLRRGLAQLLQGTPVRRGTAVQSAPALVVLFVVVMLGLVPDLLTIAFGYALLVTVAVLVVSWVISSLIHHRRPFAPVGTIGWFEALAFVLVPPLVILAAKRGAGVTTQVSDEYGSPYTLPNDWVVNALLALSLQVTLLVMVILLTKSGLASVSRWLARETIAGVSGSAGALAGALPVLLGVVFLFFLNPGVWASVGKLSTNAYGLLIALLVVLSAAFLGSRRQLDVTSMARFEDAEALRQALVGTPMESDERAEAAVARLTFPVTVPLQGLQGLNIRLVAVLSRLVVAAVVGSAVFLFFTVLGLIVVDAEVVKGWTRESPTVLWQYRSAVRTYIISAQQMRVAGFLGVFSGFYYSLVSATDARLRIDARDAAGDMLRQALALRAVLLTSDPKAQRSSSSE